MREKGIDKKMKAKSSNALESPPAETLQIPDVSQCCTTKEKIDTFWVYIKNENSIEKIYRFVKYIYFYKT